MKEEDKRAKLEQELGQLTYKRTLLQMELEPMGKRINEIGTLLMKLDKKKEK